MLLFKIREHHDMFDDIRDIRYEECSSYRTENLYGLVAIGIGCITLVHLLRSASHTDSTKGVDALAYTSAALETCGRNIPA